MRSAASGSRAGTKAVRAPAKRRRRLPAPEAPPSEAPSATVEPELKPPGRPSRYAADLANRICERVAEGESLRRICRDPDLPSRTTVHRWLSAHPDFAGHMAGARELQADSLVEEILEIADSEAGQAPSADKVRAQSLQRDKLRIQARQWCAARLAPHKYGARAQPEGPEPSLTHEEALEALEAGDRD